MEPEDTIIAHALRIAMTFARTRPFGLCYAFRRQDVGMMQQAWISEPDVSKYKLIDAEKSTNSKETGRRFPRYV